MFINCDSKVTNSELELVLLTLLLISCSKRGFSSEITREKGSTEKKLQSLGPRLIMACICFAKSAVVLLLFRISWPGPATPRSCTRTWSAWPGAAPPPSTGSSPRSLSGSSFYKVRTVFLIFSFSSYRKAVIVADCRLVSELYAHKYVCTYIM